MEKAFQPESLYDICNGVYPLIFQLVFAFTLTFISVPYFRSSLFMFRRMFCFALSFDFSINFLTIWFPLHFCLNSSHFNEKEYPFFKMPSRSRLGIAPEIAARSRSKACHDPVKNHAGNPHGNTTGSHKITPESRTDPARKHVRIPL